ncbi:MAG: dihydroorotate dehydrogenase-like protein [Pseudomonadota bacterium]
MTDLSTDWLGLHLSSPLVPSASPLSRHLDYARQLEDEGAGALVMYSLFEEDLANEEEQMLRFGVEQGIGHHEADHFLPTHHEVTTLLEQYLEQLTRLKAALSIPVVASLNGASMSHWLEHGLDLQEAGADALELNIYYVAANIDETAEDIESRYEAIVRALTTALSIPVTIKLSSQFTALPNLVRRLQLAGARGVTLFNRFYQPSINLEEPGVDYRLVLSSPVEALLAMRWIALLYGRVELSLAATGGVHTANEALKVMAAGADVAQLCSVLLMRGPRQLGVIRAGMQAWLEEHEYTSVTQLKGSLSQQHAPDPVAFERANYSRTLNTYRLTTSRWL